MGDMGAQQCSIGQGHLGHGLIASQRRIGRGLDAMKRSER
jgi:hypothetical protein